ncbi:hypothetical protein BESB_028490 [Besnoitia besnoiti]|uniref:Transmembrane protein n=1 Tax=Besnoitia besnoiti TaxID=94643 RepID=A0A2A9M2F5_BESBE|nr:uncharacterized protein BESB_028490 [Besnoitia besnoiti]PFH31414.1 hypothetical protein BESB_028490 [Besnoitia besnoiti]
MARSQDRERGRERAEASSQNSGKKRANGAEGDGKRKGAGGPGAEGPVAGVQSRYPVMNENAYQEQKKLHLAELRRHAPSALRSFAESLVCFTYMAFIPGLLNARLRRLPCLETWATGTTSALSLWITLASWAAFFARGNVTDPASFLVAVREAKAWRATQKERPREAACDASSSRRQPAEQTRDGAGAENSARGPAEDALAALSCGSFWKVTAASLLGASVVGVVLRCFFSHVTFLPSLGALPLQVFEDLPPAMPGKVAPPFYLPSSSLLASVLSLLPASRQLQAADMLRSALVFASRLFSFLRRLGLGVGTAGVAMVLKPGGGHQEFQQQLIKSAFFKEHFGADVLDTSTEAALGVFHGAPPVDNFFSKLVHGLTNSAAGVQEEEALVLWISAMLDVFLLEVFFAILAYMAVAVQASLAVALESKIRIRGITFASLNAGCFFYFFGIPFCASVGGPMLNAGYAALVTAYRLDVVGFALLVSADLLGAYIATLFVTPSVCVESKKTAASSAPAKRSFVFRSWPRSAEKRKTE